MKNKILFIFLILVGIFLPITSVNALTKIAFEEKSNGQIDTTLHFEEGFVGGIDITFNINGDVYVKNFTFSNSIEDNNYGKKWEYNQDKHTLQIQVTAGGIGTSHNLLNSKKELSLGKIEFASNAKENVSYKLSETEFKIVDNNWASKTITQDNITLGDKVEFIYTVDNIDEEVKDNGEDAPIGNEKDNNQESNDKVTASDDTNNEKDNSNSANNNQNSEPNIDNNETVDNNKSDGSIKDKNTSERNSFNWIIIVVSGVIVIAILVGIYFFPNRKKKIIK